eukprot:gene34330-44348_t
MGFHLSDNETKYIPMKAVAEVQKMMYNWESRDLWSQMSPDHTAWSSSCRRRGCGSGGSSTSSCGSELKTTRFVAGTIGTWGLWKYVAAKVKRGWLSEGLLQDGKTIYTRAIRALPAPVLRTANIYFQHNANGNPKRYLAVPTVHDMFPCPLVFNDRPLPTSLHVTPLSPLGDQELTPISSTALLSVSSAYSSTAVTDLIGFSADLTSPCCSTIKFDTACSYSMSGDPTRLTTISASPDSIMVKGFNNTSSSVAATGYNDDSQPELYVPSSFVPLTIPLLVLQYSYPMRDMSCPHQQYLREYAQQHDIIKTLTSPITPPQPCTSTAISAQERILSTLLTGLTFRDLLFLTNNNAVSGLPRDLNATALHSFENKYGRTPDVLQLAFPDLSGNTKGYFAPKPVLTHCCQRIEAHFFEPEFNDLNSIDETSQPSLTSTQRSKLKKIKSYVQATVKAFQAKGHKVDVFSADQGVRYSASLFRKSKSTSSKSSTSSQNVAKPTITTMNSTGSGEESQHVGCWTWTWTVSKKNVFGMEPD